MHWSASARGLGGASGQEAGLVEHLDRKFIAVPEHAKDHTRDADIIDDILTALLRQNPVEALYARVGGPVRTYRLQPYTLAHWRQGLYLFALDVDEGRIKTFAVDRFRAFSRNRKETFAYPDDFDPSALVADCFGIIGGRLEDVRLEFSRSVAPYVRERVWHHSQRVEPVGEGAIEVSLRVGLSPELEAWVPLRGPTCACLHPMGSEIASVVFTTRRRKRVRSVRSIVGRHPDQDTASPHRIAPRDPYAGDEALVWLGDYADYLRHAERTGFDAPISEGSMPLDLVFEQRYRSILMAMQTTPPLMNSWSRCSSRVR